MTNNNSLWFSLALVGAALIMLPFIYILISKNPTFEQRLSNAPCEWKITGQCKGK